MVFWDISGIVAYQYLQYEAGKLLIHIEVDNTFVPESIQHIQVEAEQLFANCDIDVSLVDRIERTTLGKFRYFIQTIK